MSSHDPVTSRENDESGDMSLLDQVLGATRREERSESPEVLKSLIGEAMKGTRIRSKDTSTAIQEAIDTVEREISLQLTRILHHPQFQALEASWRGLFALVKRTETDSSLNIRVLHASKVELADDLGSELGIETSRLYQKLAAPLEHEGEAPFAILVADHEFTNRHEDITLLANLSQAASLTHCLVIAAGSPSLCGLASWKNLDDDSPLGEGIEPEHASAWDTFRASDSAESIVLLMPRVLARRPYGTATSLIEELPYEELGIAADSREPISPDQLTWMNPAYIVSAVVNDAFARDGREGVNDLFEANARIGNLVSFHSRDDDGDLVVNGPMEVCLDRRRDAELSKLGFSAIQNIRGDDSVLLNGFRTLYRPMDD